MNEQDDRPTPRRRWRPRAVGVVLALLASTMVATPSASAAVGDYLRLSAVSTAYPGHPVHLSVTWTSGGREVAGVVNLQRRTSTGWEHVRQVPVSNGAATTTITPGATNSYRLRASSTVTSGVTTSDPDGTSNTIRISRVSSPSQSAAPQLQAVRGSVQSGHAQLHVRWTRGSTPVTGKVNLQARSGSSWVHVGQYQITSGAGSISVAASSTRDYRLRTSQVQSPSGIVTSHPYGTSGTVQVAGRVTVPTSFAVTGSGWGHGVGMSQYGARGMAADGRTSSQILGHYYTGTSVTARDTSRDLRVQVLSGATSTSIRASGGQARVRLGGAIVTTLPAGTTFTVEAVSQGLRVRAGGSTWTTTSPSNGVHMEWASTRYFQPGSSVEVNTSVSGAQGLYRHGRLELRNIGNRVNAVNVVRLTDEYVYGIAEMPSSWPAHALRAQAVAARSYAAASAGSVRAACDCHLYDDTRSQNYTGWRKENEPTWGVRWRQAVDATISTAGLGHVATYGGATIPAYYFSSSGGRTQNSEDVWTAALPWARSVADPWSLGSANPNSSWTATVSQSAVRAAFGLPDVVAVSVASRTAGNGVRTAVATSSTGATASITGEQLRTRLGLRSTWISGFTS
ncbi:SpoIID/LytB domain-containing protein [Oerskovia flava]|uniref:SpoIID/LytB domain-containing protein n=1 Tax=Oerskovia flava TaxID=2986422 RepID=UPI00223F0579|nr:SpoIID/LytB domain-containing protein [Oerskovia sp. JB1-3-2]